MHIDEKKITVIYWGIDQLFLNPASQHDFETIAKQFSIQKNRYLLFAGTFEARKNIERIIEAFELLQKRNEVDIHDIKLVIAGKAAAGRFSDRTAAIKALVKKYGLTDTVIFCGFIPDDSLASLYANALCLLFPSLYEGFGFPIIEGFASGVPVITSDICSMPEIAGGAALLTDPYSVTDIEHSMYSMIENSDLREQLIEAGKKRLQAFSWTAAADKIVNDIICCL